MKQESLYTPEGWINSALPMRDKAPFVIMIGGRGRGKTFAVLRDIIESGEDFVYMRRTEKQIELAKTPDLNPFRAVNLVCGTDIVSGSISKSIAGFYHADEEGKATGEALGIGVALSTIATIRGISSQARYMCYDEFIPERHERAIKEEGTAFLNAYETLNRNNELLGKPPLKCFLLSNSNTLESPVLEALGCMETIDTMIRKCQYYRTMYDGQLAIYRYIDSPISAKKKNTVLYKVAHNADFENMALSNEFSAANYENVRIEQIEQYQPLVSIGEVTVYQHKARPQYYVVKGIKSPTRYTTLPTSKKQFKNVYWYLFDALIDGRVSYASAPVKIAFERIFEHG